MLRARNGLEEIDHRSMDDRTAAAVAELYSIRQAEIVLDDPPVTAEEVALRLRHPLSFREQGSWLWWDDGHHRLLGAVEAFAEPGRENRHLAVVEVFVRPEARRGGLGRQLVAVAGEWAAERGATAVRGYAVSGSVGEVATRALGSESVFRARISRLPLADVDRQVLRGWVDRAPERAAGYGLVTFDARCPDELLERFCRVTEVMNTAPRGELDAVDEAGDPAIVRSYEEAYAAQGKVPWWVCARDRSTGELVGYTELVLWSARPWYVDQGDTGVHPDHRGRGLGRWVKAVNLLRLLDECPDAEVVETGNGDSNAPMLHINEAMGFRPAFDYEQMRLPLAMLRP